MQRTGPGGTLPLSAGHGACLQVMACAQLVLVNLVTPPPALAPLLPMPAPARTAAAAGPAGADGWKEARYSLAVAQVSSSTAATSATASGTLTLGAHIEQSYAVARAALRSANGIKVPPPVHAHQTHPSDDSMQGTGLRVQDSGYRTQGTGLGLQESGYSTQGTCRQAWLHSQKSTLMCFVLMEALAQAPSPQAFWGNGAGRAEGSCRRVLIPLETPKP